MAVICKKCGCPASNEIRNGIMGVGCSQCGRWTENWNPHTWKRAGELKEQGSKGAREQGSGLTDEIDLTGYLDQIDEIDLTDEIDQIDTLPSGGAELSGGEKERGRKVSPAPLLPCSAAKEEEVKPMAVPEERRCKGKKGCAKFAATDGLCIKCFKEERGAHPVQAVPRIKKIPHGQAKESLKEIAARITQLRASMQLTKTAFAKEIGFVDVVIGEAEHAKTISAALIERICTRFDVRREWLLNGEGEMWQVKDSRGAEEHGSMGAGEKKVEPASETEKVEEDAARMVRMAKAAKEIIERDALTPPPGLDGLRETLDFLEHNEMHAKVSELAKRDFRSIQGEIFWLIQAGMSLVAAPTLYLPTGERVVDKEGLLKDLWPGIRKAIQDEGRSGL